ncbi:MAG: NUDIX domain-containing protein [Planctomycetes bacterium]|nr:NUDIX domain-containing protein [Planctomycetota bacterium]
MTPAAVVPKVRIAVLRGPPQAREILLLLHPQTAPQLPGGGIESGETPLEAARRELHEESGLWIEDHGEMLGPFDYRLAGGPYGDGPLETQRWHVWRVEAPAGVRDAWTHDVHGEGIDAGYRFDYRWAPLDAALVHRVHERFRPIVARLAGHLDGRVG